LGVAVWALGQVPALAPVPALGRAPVPALGRVPVRVRVSVRAQVLACPR
jgi:hypothetical protein